MSREPTDGHSWGSAGTRAPEPHYLVVGRVSRPHGVRGEVRIEVLTDYPERLELHSCLFLGQPESGASPRPRKVERLRHTKRALLLKLEDCDDRNSAEELRGMLVQIPLDRAVPLENGEYYLYQVIGLGVETDKGEALGRVIDVIETGANDVFVVQGASGELLIPAIGDVVQHLDLEARRLVVRLIPGLRADNT